MIRKIDGGFLVDPVSDVETFRGVRRNGKRFWSARRSKLAAFALKRGGFDDILPQGDALYLGAGNGYTVSFLSDIVPSGCRIYSIEFSVTAGRDLLELAMARGNIFPVIADARMPGPYMSAIPRPTWLFQDISQPDQLKIFSDHLAYMDGGTALLSLKLGSLGDGMSMSAAEAVERVPELLGDACVVVEAVSLKPYEKEHVMFMALPDTTKN